jgi:hypothetical protein
VRKSVFSMILPDAGFVDVVSAHKWSIIPFEKPSSLAAIAPSVARSLPQYSGFSHHPISMHSGVIQRDFLRRSSIRELRLSGRTPFPSRIASRIHAPANVQSSIRPQPRCEQDRSAPRAQPPGYAVIGRERDPLFPDPCMPRLEEDSWHSILSAIRHRAHADDCS